MPWGVSLQAKCAAGPAGARADSLGSVWARVREWSCGRCLIVPQIWCKPQLLMDMGVSAKFLDDRSPRLTCLFPPCVGASVYNTRSS